MTVLHRAAVAASVLGRTHGRQPCQYYRTRPTSITRSSCRLLTIHVLIDTDSLPPSPTSLTREPQTLAPSGSPVQTAPRPYPLLTQVKIEQQKTRSRPQNLTTRWQRLERSLRGKGAYAKQINELVTEADGDESGTHVGVPGTAGWKGKQPRMFDGFVVPDKPSEPEADECCMSGCTICVYDLYAAALEDYKLAMEALRTTLLARNIPEKEWPEDVRAAGPQNENKRAKQDTLRDITLNAFEALERSLREKQERDKSDMGPG